MMEIESLYSLKHWVRILCVCVMVAGCTKNLTGHEGFTGEGFRSSTPDHQTRAVVWGNHSVAVTQAAHWLNDHEILVLYRSAAREFDGTSLPSPTISAAQNHMQSVANRVGAPLVVLVEVNEKGVAKKIDLSNVEDPAPKIIEVEIRGMNAKTKDAEFGATVSNSEPVLASEKLVMDLTTFALEKALKGPTTSVPPQQDVDQSLQPREHVVVHPAVTNEKMAQVFPNSPPLEDPPTTISQIPAQSNLPGSAEMMENEAEPLVYSTEENILETELEPEYSSSLDEGSPAKESSTGLHIASGALSLLYTPIKVTYAVLGGFFGGFAYILTGGNEETATSVWDGSLGGTYLIRPEHLRGDEAIRFMGPSSKTEDVT